MLLHCYGLSAINLFLLPQPLANRSLLADFSNIISPLHAPPIHQNPRNEHLYQPRNRKNQSTVRANVKRYTYYKPKSSKMRCSLPAYISISKQSRVAQRRARAHTYLAFSESPIVGLARARASKIDSVSPIDWHITTEPMSRLYIPRARGFI